MDGIQHSELGGVFVVGQCLPRKSPKAVRLVKSKVLGVNPFQLAASSRSIRKTSTFGLSSRRSTSSHRAPFDVSFFCVPIRFPQP